MRQDTEQGHLNSYGDVSGLFRESEGSVEILKLESPRKRVGAEGVGSSSIRGKRWGEEMKERGPLKEPVTVLWWLGHMWIGGRID